MAMSNITVRGITPALEILGDYQRFVYGDNLSSFQLDNVFIPTNLLSSQINFETRNNTLSGFRWIHKTLSGETTGSLKLQSFLNASPTGTDIMLFDQDGTINIIAPVAFTNTTITLTGDISASGNLSSTIVTTFIDNPIFTGNEYMQVPTGTTAQRPSLPSVGMIRCNTTL